MAGGIELEPLAAAVRATVRRVELYVVDDGGALVTAAKDPEGAALLDTADNALRRVGRQPLDLADGLTGYRYATDAARDAIRLARLSGVELSGIPAEALEPGTVEALPEDVARYLVAVALVADASVEVRRAATRAGCLRLDGIGGAELEEAQAETQGATQALADALAAENVARGELMGWAAGVLRSVLPAAPAPVERRGKPGSCAPEPPPPGW
ncbi:MAG: hypothetical protein SF028_11655 [Candidatus Sumerlaeia bacterium]|nr:hypothetical protein [Candidatus Sumerlaeia bacterium]